MTPATARRLLAAAKAVIAGSDTGRLPLYGRRSLLEAIAQAEREESEELALLIQGEERDGTGKRCGC